MNIMPTPLLDQIKAEIDSLTKLKEALGLATDLKNADYLMLGGFVKGAAHENDTGILWLELVRLITTMEEEPREPEQDEMVLFLTAAKMGHFALQQGKQMGRENPLEEIKRAALCDVKMLDVNKRFAETNGDEDIDGAEFTAEGDDNATRH